MRMCLCVFTVVEESQVVAELYKSFSHPDDGGGGVPEYYGESVDVFSLAVTVTR